MNSENIYEKIIDVLENKFRIKSRYLIKDIMTSKEFKQFDYSKIKALLTHLIRIGKISIVDDQNEQFEHQYIEWKFEKEYSLPKPKKSHFQELVTCVSLPPFNIYGLTDFLERKNIKINLLKDEFSKLFESAKMTIKICSPFLEWNGFVFFKDILLLKARQKVKIKILSRQINKNDNYTRFENVKRIFDFFRSNSLEDQVEIRNYYFQTEDKKLASSIHAKLIIIDNKQAYIGSGEIRENSFKKNLEIGFILAGEKVPELVLIFDNIFSKSEVVSFD